MGNDKLCCLSQLIGEPNPPGNSSARLIKAGKTSETSRDKGSLYLLCSEFLWVRKLTFGRTETMGLVGLVRYYLLEIMFACFSFTFRSFCSDFCVTLKWAFLDRKVKYFVSEMDKFISGVKEGAVFEGWHEHWRRDKSSLSANLGRLSSYHLAGIEVTRRRPWTMVD